MPSKPKRPCSAPGCPELTRERFCQLHAKEADKNYRKFRVKGQIVCFLSGFFVVVEL